MANRAFSSFPSPLLSPLPRPLIAASSHAASSSSWWKFTPHSGVNHINICQLETRTKYDFHPHFQKWQISFCLLFFILFYFIFFIYFFAAEHVPSCFSARFVVLRWVDMQCPVLSRCLDLLCGEACPTMVLKGAYRAEVECESVTPTALTVTERYRSCGCGEHQTGVC